MIGQTVSHYRILEKLGEGGMGVVYKAEDTKLRRSVALKFLPSNLLVSEVDRQRFVHEAQASATLSHPNIATIFEIDEWEAKMFIALEYIEGQNLAEKIKLGPLKLDEALSVAIQTCEGLQAAHEKGIVHRDVKSQNIMVTTKGQVKILDFGLAKLRGATAVTKTGTTVGTMGYMSPEQLRGEPVDHRTDIWAMGVVLYEMIAGRRPFQGDYEDAVAYQVSYQNPELLTALRTGVPMELERIVKKAMQKDRSLRYQHVADLLADLTALRAELGHTATIAGSLIPKFPRNRQKYLYAGVAAITVVLAAVIVYFWQSSKQSGRINGVEEGKEETAGVITWSKSIAVLPFKNVSPDSGQEYFCDGMTEQIITNLSRLQRLGVTNYRSVSRYKHTEKTIAEIGKELNTAYILDGSVYKSGNRIRITAQLTRAEVSQYLWANDYVCNLEDVFAVQDSVSQAIATQLLETLSPSEASQTKTKGTKNTEAYDCFLKGEYCQTRFDRVANLEDYRNAEKFYKKAIELDSTYALAYAGLAYVYSNYMAYFPPSKEGRKQSISLQDNLIQTALRLDPNSAEILAIVANILFVARGEEFEKSYEMLKKALEINPNNVDANLNMGYWLRNRGLVHNSFKYFDKGQALDPLHPWTYAARGWSFWLIGESDKAMEEYRKALQIEPNDLFTSERSIWALIFTKQLVEAENLLGKYEKNWPGREEGRLYKAWLLAAKGEKEKALRTYREIANPGKYSEIGLYILLDMKDEAIRLLDEQQREGSQDSTHSNYLSFKYCHTYDGIRDDKRFQEIIAREKEKYDVLLKNYGI